MNSEKILHCGFPELLNHAWERNSISQGLE